MIAASVRLQEPLNEYRFIDESPINVWLLAHVGTHARYIDMVDETLPWHVEHGRRYLVYHFARKQDATMFALRWL